MSQTTQPFVSDQYLARQVKPVNELKIDPQWHTVDLVTPVGRARYVHVETPFAVPPKPPQQPGQPKYSCTIAMHMAPQTDEPVYIDIIRAACMVADAHWPAVQMSDPGSPTGIKVVPGSQCFASDGRGTNIQWPIYDGNAMFATDPVANGWLRGLSVINSTMWPMTKAGKPQRPACIDTLGNEIAPSAFYPGCYVRLLLSVRPYEQMGNRGVRFDFRTIQFIAHPDGLEGRALGRLASGDNAVGRSRKFFDQAGAMPYVDPAMAPPPVTALPAYAPPGVAGMPGFAPPPQQSQQPVYQAQAPIPPQQMPQQTVYAAHTPAGQVSPPPGYVPQPSQQPQQTVYAPQPQQPQPAAQWQPLHPARPPGA